MRFAVLAVLVVGCGDPKFSVEQLQDPTTCKECHPKHYEQWSGSMHAYSSEDPVFVAMNKRGQRDTGGALGDFCIQCHAPMAVLNGTATGANFDPAALSASDKGITCFFCHNVETIERDHNNGLVLAMDQTMRGGTKNAADNPAHNSAYDVSMASRQNDSRMCGSCHDIITPAGIHIERSFAEWKTTVFNVTDSGRLTCVDCHMKPSDGVIASGPGLDVGPRELGFHEHMWPAIDQALTPFPQIDEQRARIIGDLDPAVQIVGTRPLGSDIAKGGICLDPPGADPAGNLSVRIDSIGPGHMFPSGAAQDRRTWLEVTAYDVNGAVIFETGKVQPGVDPEKSGLPQINGFWDRTFKADNTEAHFFWEVARVDSQLLAPAITRDENATGYDHSTTFKFQVLNYAAVDRIEAQLYVRPLSFTMVDDLIASGDLDPSIRTALLPMTFAPIAAKSTWLKATKGKPGTPAEFTNCNPLF